MATIQENRKNGKLVSYKFTACVGRDANGKQIRYYRTWTPPREYAPAKARKCAQMEATQWEQAIRKHGINGTQALDCAAARRAEKTDFCAFITDTWLPIQVCNGSKKPKTEDFYKSMAKLICKYFDGWFLQDIRPIDIQKYLIYLRTEYTGKSGKPLTAKTLSHQYSTLHLIFGYAEQQELISKNPMHKVDTPRKEKRPVDALTQAQAQRFFQCLHDCPLDFQCMLHLLITTGIRRGECLGLKWKDIDARAATLNIARNVTYTVKSGTIVSSPKTAAGIRTVPLLGPHCLCCSPIGTNSAAHIRESTLMKCSCSRAALTFFTPATRMPLRAKSSALCAEAACQTCPHTIFGTAAQRCCSITARM